MEILVDNQDVRIIFNLYWNKIFFIHVEGEDSGDIEIKRGVFQGSVLLPLLFNIYSERILQKSTDNIETGNTIICEYVYNVGYVNDTVVFLGSFKWMQGLINCH